MPFAVSRFKRLCLGMVVINLPSCVLILQCFLPSKISKPHCFAILTSVPYEQSATLTFNPLSTLAYKLQL
ncbi:MAG: hypothetical protein US45_C0048G0005 [Candidatus Nomurabacteria bacterium GW2011_GWA1_37_20]|uniref:Uncharacterized protein n=1 Tax=Candidatus Nomurabacteria bacterium GW2011_GWA1_37_20 TaxID=1618729 RepID=A0A0G0GVA3_9BACT|nr:MAG: hypothetical protein US45_C0048G0005 [Candidatus Nomurabacteria bacterium GW2011_GWA1_37_20]